ncbi:MAG: hypothetical protein AB7T49_11635 [Oligoflexales bacterium]
MSLFLVILGTAMLYTCLFSSMNSAVARWGNGRFFSVEFLALYLLTQLLPAMGPLYGTIPWAEIFVTGFVVAFALANQLEKHTYARSSKL